jgi:hypothetical protein
MSSAGGSMMANGMEVTIGELPSIRDTPRPVFLARDHKPALLISPGADVGAPAISVYTMDTEHGVATPVATIDRYSTRNITGLAAAIVGGRLYVAWVEATSDEATIRARVVPEP